jgi:hypothetical protein
MGKTAKEDSSPAVGTRNQPVGERSLRSPVSVTSFLGLTLSHGRLKSGMRTRLDPSRASSDHGELGTQSLGFDDER